MATNLVRGEEAHCVNEHGLGLSLVRLQGREHKQMYRNQQAVILITELIVLISPQPKSWA